MPTKRLRWPNHAEWARVETIAKAMKNKRLCDQLIHSDNLNRVQVIQVADQIKEDLLEIEHMMKICKNPPAEGGRKKSTNSKQSLSGENENVK